MRSTYFFHSKGFIFAVERVQMFLKHDETCIAQKSNWIVCLQNGPMSDMERLELFEKLEKAEGRIVALEKQVKHSAAFFHFLEVWRFALSDMS